MKNLKIMLISRLENSIRMNSNSLFFNIFLMFYSKLSKKDVKLYKVTKKIYCVYLSQINEKLKNQANKANAKARK